MTEKRLRRLTALQERFVAAYLAGARVVMAARQAGYSEKTATHSAARLMRAPHIKAAIADGWATRQRKEETLHDQVVRELESLAFAPLNDGTVRPADKLRALDLLSRIAERMIRLDAACEKTDGRENGTIKNDRAEKIPSVPPAWEEAMRRGLERVEQGRRADAERNRLAEKNTRKKDPQTEKTAEKNAVPLGRPPVHTSGITWRHARHPAFFTHENGEVCSLPLPASNAPHLSAQIAGQWNDAENHGASLDFGAANATFWQSLYVGMKRDSAPEKTFY